MIDVLAAIPPQSAGVMGAAFVTALGAVIVSIVTGRTAVRVKSIQTQVENSHTTNLREELDTRHEETKRWFNELRQDLRETRTEAREDNKVLSGRIRVVEKKLIERP